MADAARKRSFGECAQDGEELKIVLPKEDFALDGASKALESMRDAAAAQSPGEWQLVDHKRKKHKKNKQAAKDERVKPEARTEKKEKQDTRPALTCAEQHKLNSSLRIADLQQLVLYCLADGVSPQWISVKHHGGIRKAVVLMVPGLEKSMFTGKMKLEGTSLGDTLFSTADGSIRPERTVSLETPDSKHPDEYLPIRLDAGILPGCLSSLTSTFSQLFPIKAPGDAKGNKVHSPVQAILTAPLPKSQEEKQAEKSIRGPKLARTSKDFEDEPVHVTACLTSAEDLLESDYTMHPACFDTEEEIALHKQRREASKTSSEHGWHDADIDALPDKPPQRVKLSSKPDFGPFAKDRTVLAIDCEMVKVEGDESALARVSVLDWYGNVVLDELVKPDRPVVDYLTAYSGVTPEKLNPITTNLSDIQKKLLSMFDPSTILLGHSLNSDLTALKMTHPAIIDTSILYPHPRGPPLKSSLKFLAQKYLSREIQANRGTLLGHDSIEDAKACLDLVRLKCRKGAKWGTNEAAGESIFARLGRTPRNGSRIAISDGRTGAVVDHGNPGRGIGANANYCLSCKSDVEVVEGVKRCVKGDSDGKEIPGGGVDFVFARLRELEACRRWSTDAPTTNPGTHTDSIVDGAGGTTKEEFLLNPSPEALAQALTSTVSCIDQIGKSLPPCTLFIVYSGTGDPRQMKRLSDMYRTHRREYNVKKWDELSVKWTDTEEQALKKAVQMTRQGVGFVTVT